MSSKVNYGKYRVNTDGLVFRVDGYSQRSYNLNTQSWKDLSPSGLDVTLTETDLYDETSGYYKFRKGASENDFGAVSGENFTGLRSLGVLKNEESSFSIEVFFSCNIFLASTNGHAVDLSKFVFSITIYNNKISYIWRFY